MTPALRIAASAAAVVALVVAVAAVGLHPSGPGAVVNTPSPAPTATPSAGPSSAAQGPGLIPFRGGPVPLTAGTNVAASPFPKKITLTLPDGWYGNIGGPYAVFLSRLGPTAEVDFVIFNEIYADPCHFDRGR